MKKSACSFLTIGDMWARRHSLNAYIDRSYTHVLIRYYVLYLYMLMKYNMLRSDPPLFPPFQLLPILLLFPPNFNFITENISSIPIKEAVSAKIASTGYYDQISITNLRCKYLSW